MDFVYAKFLQDIDIKVKLNFQGFYGRKCLHEKMGRRLGKAEVKCHSTMMQIWLLVKEEKEERLSESVYDLSKVEWKFIKAIMVSFSQSWPSGRVLWSSGTGCLSKTAAISHWLGAAHGKPGLSTTEAVNLRCNNLGPRSVKLPVVGSLQGTFSRHSPGKCLCSLVFQNSIKLLLRKYNIF